MNDSTRPGSVASHSASRSFLGRLGPDAREMLVGLGRVRRYPAQSILFLEGDHAYAVHVIRSGVVKVSATVAAREVVLDVLGKDDVLGELSVLDGRPRSATATTLVATELIAISANAFMDFLTEHPAASMELLRGVAGRLRDASRRQVEYGALDGIGRVCRRLIEMIDRYGGMFGREVVIEGPLTQGDIAAWAGLSREAVVKALHAMRALGWVRTDARSISVLDVAAVRRRASADLA